MNTHIPFNKPFISGRELEYIQDAVLSGKISGNGKYTNKCQQYFQRKYDIKKALLTTSCTDALEMCAILANIKPGDEVIIPSFTFVSTALAFIREGAKVVFADSRPDHPGVDEDKIESLITEKTKAIVPVHYAGVACDMNKIMGIAAKYNLIVIEDAAHSFDSYYKDRPLGSIGNMAVFSFHETKNINAGEGGLIAINDDKYLSRSEIIWEKGTNRAEFFRGEINKYGWVDTGSSFLPSEIIAAYLLAQLESSGSIQKRRIELWNRYNEGLKDWSKKSGVSLPHIPDYAMNNGHMFYMICKTPEQRNELIEFLKTKNILAVFHYVSLHKSPYHRKLFKTELSLNNSERYSELLVRLPMFYELSNQQVDLIVNSVKEF